MKYPFDYFLCLLTLTSHYNISGAGCKQLVADVGYISNVMGALEVPLSRDIVDISKLLSCSIDQLVLGLSQSFNLS